MQRKSETNPIFFESKEEMDKIELSEHIKILRYDVNRVRGKLRDLRVAYGHDDWIDYIEGTLTSVLVTMYDSYEEFLKIEKRMEEKNNT